MEKYPWWTEGQKRLADEVEDFADEVLPRVAEAVYLKEHPRDILRKIAEKGWFGVLVPEEYGGMGKNGGVTGCCIISEGLCKAGFIGGLFFSTMFGGVNQLVNFGTDEQKERWLPRVAKGELLGAIALTEPFVGSDAGGVMTRARREGDEYVINGKKRFVSNTGVADVYLVYARTSDDPADVQSRRHMTAFIVEKGTPGFSVEKVNELAVFDGVRNGVLDFNDVRVPAENVVGGEGNGWNVMINGLNFERLMIAVGVVAGMREAIRYSLFFTERRVQFGLRTIDFESNQYKIADMIIRYQTARLMTYYTAYLMDQGLDPSIESNVAKIYATEACREAAIDALQVAGGDAFTKFYPIEMV
ncbi:MAG: acyl-CoA dehydrogenase family protein [Candidatus Freyarchaeota archaeon]|nr:acyl-CoA dehydrogenase family protein [Candidatus Freyrarchaeum guaymaensis]